MWLIHRVQFDLNGSNGTILEMQSVVPGKGWLMRSFDDLATSRKEWINQQLKPWCQQAGRTDLIRAEAEWVDIAGKVMPEKTLWLWAWSRFPELVHESLGIEETLPVQVTLNNGQSYVGFPDSRKSLKGQLLIWGDGNLGQPPQEFGPFSIDEIIRVRRAPDGGDSSVD